MGAASIRWIRGYQGEPTKQPAMSNALPLYTALLPESPWTGSIVDGLVKHKKLAGPN